VRDLPTARDPASGESGKTACGVARRCFTIVSRLSPITLSGPHTDIGYPTTHEEAHRTAYVKTSSPPSDNSTTDARTSNPQDGRSASSTTKHHRSVDMSSQFDIGNGSAVRRYCLPITEPLSLLITSRLTHLACPEPSRRTQRHVHNCFTHSHCEPRAQKSSTTFTSQQKDARLKHVTYCKQTSYTKPTTPAPPRRTAHRLAKSSNWSFTLHHTVKIHKPAAQARERRSPDRHLAARRSDAGDVKCQSGDWRSRKNPKPKFAINTSTPHPRCSPVEDPPKAESLAFSLAYGVPTLSG
jgi:hypothetical protein